MDAAVISIVSNVNVTKGATIIAAITALVNAKIASLTVAGRPRTFSNILPQYQNNKSQSEGQQWLTN
jgi:hypothetical protein